jgi:hypothetical protein
LKQILLGSGREPFLCPSPNIEFHGSINPIDAFVVPGGTVVAHSVKNRNGRILSMFFTNINIPEELSNPEKQKQALEKARKKYKELQDKLEKENDKITQERKN